MKKPNIVYFVADQMRSDSLHHLGNEASITPNLDSFAQEEAVSFKNAYCQNPVCVPSRNSFLSGLYPHTTGHRTMHFLQNPDDPNILKVMKEAGYQVIWVGRNDVVPADKTKSPYCDEYYDGKDFFSKLEPNKDSGFHHQSNKDVVVGPELYSFYVGKAERGAHPFIDLDWNYLQSALDFLDRKANGKDNRPFFLYLTLNYPHPPYVCEDPWYSSIDASKLEKRRPSAVNLEGKSSMLRGIAKNQGLDVWDESKFDELRKTYLAMVSRFDSQFKILRDKLIEHNFYDDSSVFVFSDHGDFTTDYSVAEKAQNCFENPVSNVPLMIKPSKAFKVKPGVSEALVELVDLSATIADMTETKIPYVQFGKSLKDAIAGSPVHKDAVICEGGRIHGEEHAKELGHVETSPYYPRLSTQYSDGPEHTKAVMIRMGNKKYTYRLYEDDEFYDLDKDPYEIHNDIHNPDYAEDIAAMQKRLLQFMIETGDYVPVRRDKR